MMRKSASSKWKTMWKNSMIVTIVGCMTLTSACAGTAGNGRNNTGTNQGATGTGQAGGNSTQMQGTASNSNQGMRILSGNAGGGNTAADGSLSIPIAPRNGMPYVSLNEIAEALEYSVDYDQETLTVSVGDFGAEIELKVNSTEATREEEAVSLPGPTEYTAGRTFIPLAAVPLLFSDDMSYTTTETELRIQPSGVEVNRADMDAPDDTATDAELDFEDDPNDPFKGDEGEGPDDADADISVFSDLDAAEQEAIMAAMKNIDMNRLIRTARRYLGVKYDFGARPYPQSRRFDCSTYTRYIFGKYGVSLPRTARAQATRGTYVSRKNLRKGDLMFFYVPGRFKSNKKVGHVGIYMGNKRMIHASPEPKNGVQITSINKAYWKRTYLRSKRVAY
jgi:cell wall-associated NlpC family hydrolase